MWGYCMSDINRDIGSLNARVGLMEESMREMRADVKAMRTVMDQNKGGWKMLVMLSGLAGTAGAASAKLLTLAGLFPR